MSGGNILPAYQYPTLVKSKKVVLRKIRIETGIFFNRWIRKGLMGSITHRCHKREFLLKFDKDNRRWIHWLFGVKNYFEKIDTWILERPSALIVICGNLSANFTKGHYACKVQVLNQHRRPDRNLTVNFIDAVNQFGDLSARPTHALRDGN